MAVLTQVLRSLASRLPYSLIEAHDSAIILAFNKIKMRSSSSRPASSASSSALRMSDFLRSARSSNRAWRASVNLNKYTSLTCLMVMPDSTQLEGCTITCATIALPLQVQDTDDLG